MKFFLFTITIVFCSVVPGCAQPGDPGDENPFEVPISGIEWLLLGGGLLGAKKIYSNFKKEKPKK